MTGALVIRSSALLACTAGAVSTRPQIGRPARLPRAIHPSLPAYKSQRLVAAMASSVDTAPEPETPLSQQNQSPLQAVTQLATVAIKLVVDAWNLLQVRTRFFDREVICGDICAVESSLSGFWCSLLFIPMHSVILISQFLWFFLHAEAYRACTTCAYSC